MTMVQDGKRENARKKKKAEGENARIGGKRMRKKKERPNERLESVSEQ